MENKPDINSLKASLQGRKIVLVNHCDTLGEASIATFRLMQALRREGIDARMVVYTRTSNEPNISQVGSRLQRGLRYTMERLQILVHSGFSDKNIFAISTGSFALNVHKHPWIKEADIVCINWVSQGLMNLKGIKRLHEMGKKIVWTMHDMWAFTGICHESFVCDYYKDQCGNCMYLKDGGHPDDLSHRVWEKKMRLYPDIPITFVAQTKWLELKARNSSLLRNKPVMTINSPIAVDWYYTTSDQLIGTLLTGTKPNLIMIGATLLDGQGRGLEYSIDALNHIFDNYPEIASDTAVYFFGDLNDPSILDSLRMSHRWLGRVNDPKILRYLFSMAKVIMSSSLFDDLPVTMVEGMAGGAIPVFFGGFGREDLVTHLENGYSARPRDTVDLANGLVWAIQSDISRDELHEYVESRFSPKAVAEKYIELFAQII